MMPGKLATQRSSVPGSAATMRGLTVIARPFPGRTLFSVIRFPGAICPDAAGNNGFHSPYRPRSVRTDHTVMGGASIWMVADAVFMGGRSSRAVVFHGRSYFIGGHFTGTGLVGCAAKTDACVLDQNSVYARVFGIPVAIYGTAFYAFMIAVCVPRAWRSPRRIIRQARLAAVVIGMIFVLYLIYREVISLGHICEYCTSVHVITFLVFALVLYDSTGSGRDGNGH